MSKMAAFPLLMARGPTLLFGHMTARVMTVASLVALVLGCSEPDYEERAKDGGAADAKDEMRGSSARADDDGGALDASSARPAADGETIRQPPNPSVPSGKDAALPAAPPDAAPPSMEATRMPASAEPLLGTYATRTIAFQRFIYLEIPVMTTQEEIAVVRIERDGRGGAQSHTKLCSRMGESSEEIERFLDPSGLPEITRQLVFSGDSWAEDAAPHGLGYERDIPADCERRENMAIARRPHQVWIANGQCRCPISPESPPTADDCRVLDPDGDRKPGFTLVDKGKENTLVGDIVNQTVYVGLVSRDHHVEGRVAPDGAHFARRVQDHVLHQLACLQGPIEQCPKYGDSTRPCTSAHNFTSFRRLKNGEPANCESVLARKAELFTEPLPKPLQSCTLQVLTDEPTRR